MTGRKKSDFLLLRQKDPLMNYCQKYTFKFPACSHFLWNLGKFEIQVKFQRILKGHSSPVCESQQIKGSKERDVLWVYRMAREN